MDKGRKCSHCKSNQAASGGYCLQCHAAYRRAKRINMHPLCPKCQHPVEPDLSGVDELTMQFLLKLNTVQL